MGVLSDILNRLSADASRSYVHGYVGEKIGPARRDASYVRVWLRSARITDVRRWTKKFYPTVHARFVHADAAVGMREVMTVCSPNKTFQELDARHLDRFIVVNQPLLGPIPFRGDLSSEIALFSVAGDDLAKPYLDLLSDLSATAAGSALAAVEPIIAPLKRGAEVLLMDQTRAELEIGLARTDTELYAGNIVVARTEGSGAAFRSMSLDPDDFRLLDADGRPIVEFPYMVIGIAIEDRRSDFRSIPDIRTAWKGVTDAAQKGESEQAVQDAFRALMRVVNFSPDLVAADRKAIVGVFASEVLQAGYALSGIPGLPPPAAGATESAAVATVRALPVTESATVEQAWNPASGRISIADARRMILDPGVPEHVVRQLLLPDPEASKPFAPAVRFNPDVVVVPDRGFATEGAQMMGWANELSAWRRNNAFLARMAAKDPRPVLVSVGDSWFQFPIFLDDVVDQMESSYSIWSLDAAGDTLENMVLREGRHLAGLTRWKGRARALLVSGSGNDIVGEDPDGVSVLTKIVKPFKAGKTADWYIDTAELARRIGLLETCFSRVFSDVANAFPGLPVLCHGYDHAIPAFPGDPRHPIWAKTDAWLAGPMSNTLGIRDPALQRAIVAALIDRLNAMQRRLCGGNAGGRFPNAWHVDVRGTVAKRWADELHPTDDGFAAVSGLFRSTLSAALAAAAPETAAFATESGTASVEDAALAVPAAGDEAGRFEVLTGAGASASEAGPAAPAVSARALDLIVAYETGGRPFYDKVIRRRPIWPKGNSGITIGFGYDLGYVEAAEFERDWSALPAPARARLATSIGRHGGIDSAADLKAFVASFSDIEVAWETAEAVFAAATVPKFVTATTRALANTDALSPDAFGALVSLSFNRGAAYRKARDPSDALDRYREMRAIGEAMKARRFAEIPGLIRLMKRIWKGTAVEEGLSRRREDEALLFEAGLSAMPAFGTG